jgi:hypothetical protein
MKFCAPTSFTAAAVSSTFTRRQWRIHARSRCRRAAEERNEFPSSHVGQ